MPNGRWTNQQIGTIKVKSTSLAVVDPVSLGERLGIDPEAMLAAIRELVDSGDATRWTAVNHRYRVFMQQHDDEAVTWSISS